ncbi:MAG: DoxX family protein [Gemmatimonadales bacterium]
MSSLIDGATLSSGLLIARLVFGLLMVGHGTQKLFGWFGGYGLAGTGGFFEGLGFRPGRAFAAAASLTEIAGGLLLALGFLGPVGPALIISVMLVAAISVHWQNGLFATSNGIELPLLYAAGAISLALTGPGHFSLDAVLGLTSLWTPGIVWAAIAIGVVGGVVNLALRRSAPQHAAA